MHSKKLILLDLDNTLFDSSSYRKSVFAKLGNADLCQKIYDKMLDEFGYFLPKMFVEILSSRLKGTKEKKIMDVIFDQKNFRDNLHKEILISLKMLIELGEVGILSQGDKEFQHAKISHFKHLLSRNHINIVKNKKSDMVDVFKNIQTYKIYFVDDILHMLETAKKINPQITTIWMKRGRYAQNQREIPGFTPDAEVENLSEVVKIVKEN